MSDETGPALSRRALREQRRAEAEAQLAREAEALGRSAAPIADKPVVPAVAPIPAAKPAAKPAKDASPKPAVAKPEAAKPATEKPQAKPAATQPATPKSTAAAAKPAVTPAKAETPKPVAAKPEAAKQEKPAEQDEAPVRSRRAASGEVDALPERATLQRARDREALRTRRRLEQEVSDLSSNEPSPGDDPAPLTRKQLRLQMLQEAAGKSPAAPKAATPPKEQQAKPAANAPAPAKAPTGAASASKPAAAKPAAKAPAPAKAVPPVEVLSVEDALALRRRAGSGAPLAPAPVADDLGDVDLEVLAQQRELAARAAIIGRRAAERQRLEESNSARAGARKSDPFTGAMHHLRDEDSERAFINTGISGPETRGFHISMTEEGTIVDAAAQVAPKAPAANAPTTKAPSPKNSAVSAPAPTVKPADKPAAATPAQAAPIASKATGAKPAAAAAPAAKAPAKTGQASTKPKAAAKPAPAAATAAKPAPKVQAPAPSVEPAVTHPPVRAVRAQGLEPLDAQTAGMRRANNMYLMVIAALSVGGAALVAGLIMILNSN